MIDQGKYAVVNLSQFVTAAKSQLFGTAEGSDNDIWFESLANEAIRHYDCLSIFKKNVCKLTVEDKKAKLPSGFNRILALQYGVGSGCGRMMYVDMDFLTSCGTDCDSHDTVPFSPSFEIQDGYVYIHQEPSYTYINDKNEVVEVTEEVTSLTIAYIGLNVDDDGLMKGFQDMERGIKHYICWCFCLQNMDVSKYAAQMNFHYELWKAQKRWMKGKDWQDSFMNTRRQIAEWSHALVADKNWSI